MYPSIQGWNGDQPCVGLETGEYMKTREKYFNNGNIKILMNQTFANLSNTTNLKLNQTNYRRAEGTSKSRHREWCVRRYHMQ